MIIQICLKHNKKKKIKFHFKNLENQLRHSVIINFKTIKYRKVGKKKRRQNSVPHKKNKIKEAKNNLKIDHT